MERKRKPLSQLPLINDTSRKSKKKRGEEPEKRAGSILQMILKNFMCHSLLDVDLSGNVNIIIGRNGSGKSALMTALIVGLGGKASLTNRGTSIKGFIKAGSQSGSVEIQLYNGGSMAYRPKVYGSKITIIRNFSASGKSTYRVKNEKDEVIATQIGEVNNIVTGLNIQVDNPVCILNQDISRNFLNSNDPKHRFKLFMKATKLESLSDEYKKISSNKRESIRIYEEKKVSFQQLQDDLRILKTKIDNQRSIVSIRDNIKQMQIEFLWAKVRDAEEELGEEENKVSTWEVKHQNLKEECAGRSQRLENIRENIADLNRQISELKDTILVQSRPQLDVEKLVDGLITKYNEKRREKQLIQSVIESKNKDADSLKKVIENINENMTRVQQEKVQRLHDLNNMNEKIKDIDDHLQTCMNDLYQLNNDVARKDEEKQRLRRDLNRADQQISNEKSSLNALQNETGNTLLLYGRDIPRVKQLIEQNRDKFKHVPRGPLGSYIKLKEKKWATAIESYLGFGLLGSFIVDNIDDNQLLLKIFNQVWSSGRKPTIITSQFFYRKHNVAENLVRSPSDCVSLYEALEIEDPIVSNCIVDQAGVEGILLIPTNDRAIELLSHARNVPTNCTQGVTIKGDKFYPDPDYKTYGSRYHRAKFLQVDTKEHILQLEHNIKELTEKKQNIETQLMALTIENNEQESEKSQLEEKIKKMNAARSLIRRQLNDLKSTADPEVATVEIFEGELNEIRNIVQEKNAQLIQIKETLKEIKLEIKQNEEKLKKIKDSNSSIEDRMRNLESQVKEDSIRLKEISSSEEFDKRRIKEVERKLNEARAELVMKQQTVHKYTEQARTVGERLETERKVPEIVSEMKQLEMSVKRIETNTESIEQLLQNYHEMSDKFNKVSTILTCLSNDIKELTAGMEKRSRHYKLTENYFITLIKHAFKKIMEVRQFRGSIEIHMQEEKLELIVIPQHGSQGLTTASNLSGGERSFSTVAFLYALWQCMDFPFYFLDEFDVYMDKLNRTKVFEILLHHAEIHPELQFIFLTPQDVSFIKKNVSILRLSDPERNQV